MLFAIEAGLLTLFMVFATKLSPLTHAGAPETMLIVVISVLAMSLHNVHSLQVRAVKAQIAVTGLFGSFASSTVHLFALLRTHKSTAAATDRLHAVPLSIDGILWWGLSGCPSGFHHWVL